MPFNPSTQKAKASRSLSLRPTWYIDRDSNQLCLGREGNRGEQQADRNLIKQGDHVPAQVSSRTWFSWHLWPRGFYRQKRKKPQEFASAIKKTKHADATHV